MAWDKHGGLDRQKKTTFQQSLGTLVSMFLAEYI